MASTTTVVQVSLLGNLATARGRSGAAHYRATPLQMQTATQIVGAPASYSSRLENCVVCVDDRLQRRAPRLAGGALSLALMHNFLYGGRLLSANLLELKAQEFELWFHEDCDAQKKAPPLIAHELTNVNAEGYRLLASLGVVIPVPVRRRIAAWASTITPAYFDIEKAKRVIDGIDPVHGVHNAVYAVIDAKENESFVGGPVLQERTDGLLAFVFTPWVALREGQRMAVPRVDAMAAAQLGLVFTAQVFLALGGPDLRVAVRH